MKYLTLLLALLAPPTLADTWTLMPGQSQITFSYTENGAPFPGRFPAFTGTARFDQWRPQETDVDVVVDVSAVRLSDFVRTAFAKTEDWFHTAAFPSAHFYLRGIEPLDEAGLWRAEGFLDVKGRTHPVFTNFTLTRPGNCLRARGTFAMNLAELGIGQGGVSNMIRVGDDIELSFNLLGHRAGEAPACS